jgi:hypothetical protein
MVASDYAKYPCVYIIPLAKCKLGTQSTGSAINLYLIDSCRSELFGLLMVGL